MAPHTRSVSRPPRHLAWATLAVIAWCVCTPGFAATEPHADRKPRTRHTTRQQASTTAAPVQAPARVTPLHVCHDDQGRTEYRQFPCPDGGRRLQGHDDARGAGQVQHSTQMVAREKTLLRTMARDRQRLERQAIQEHTPTARAQRPRPKVDEAEAGRTAGRARRTQREPALPRYRSLAPLTAATPQERVKP